MFKVINKSKNIRQLSSLTFLIKAIRLWGISCADCKQACSCLRRLFITFQRTFQRVFDLNEWIRIINCVFILLLLDSLWPNIEHASKTLFSRFLGFFFTDTDDSTNIQTFILRLRWLSHISNRTACIYQTATRWDLPPYRITVWLIDNARFTFVCLSLKSVLQLWKCPYSSGS